MRSFWTESTVERNAEKAGLASLDEYLLSQQRLMENETGVRWSVSHQHGGYQFDPVDEGALVPLKVSLEDVEAVRKAHAGVVKSFGGYVTYLAAHLASGIPLGVLMGLVRRMEKEGLALRTVNRMGKGYAFKLKGWGYEGA